MKKFISIFITFILVIALNACRQTGAPSSQSDDVSGSISTEQVSDDELVNIAMDIAKEENNYVYWLFSSSNIDSDDIVTIETKYTLNGEEFSSFDDYAPVSEFDSIEDFIGTVSKYLSAEYVENYLYQFVGLHPTENIPIPLLKELDGKLYKLTSGGGVSPIPNTKYEYGEVIEKTDVSATVRLYIDKSVDADIDFFDYPLIFESGVWKHNPTY